MDWNTDDARVRQVLEDRWEWLGHQSRGSAATKRSAWRDLGDAGAAEDRVRNSHTGRYPIELLQNAHDACADAATVGSAWFTVTAGALLIGNQGTPFTAERIESLIRIGSSEKGRRKVRHHLIGYKGIGFTAVFEITDTPQIISRNVAFMFDRQQALRRVIASLGRSERSEQVAARNFPLPLDQNLWAEDAEAIERLLGAGAATVIRLPFRRGWATERVLKDLRASLSGEILLFTPSISRIQISAPTEAHGWLRTKGRSVGSATLWHLSDDQGGRRSWLVRAGTTSIARDEAAALRDELWREVRRLNVAVALPWSSGPVAGSGDLPLFAYFPTADRVGRGVLVHGDFYLDEARQRIAAAGPQGAISNRVAERAASYLAEIAEANAQHGNKLLSCLAPHGQPDGYGHHVAAKIDAALKGARIVRPADGSAPRKPPQIRRIGSALSVEKERKFSEMLVKRSDVVLPGDDAGAAGELLTRLESALMEPQELASRVEPARAGMEYSTSLALLESWVEHLQWKSYTAIAELKKRRVVQDRAGAWCSPGDVLQRDPATPALPSILDRPELRLPTSTAARKFVARLDIDTLTATAGVDLILSRLAKSSELSKREHRDVLRFLWTLWKNGQLSQARTDLDAIRVPAKRADGRGTVSWLRAGSAYFGSGWVTKTHLALLYGPFGRSEFVASNHLDAGKRDQEGFFRALGVSMRPRMLPVTTDLKKYLQWRSLAETRKAEECPEGHPQTARRFEGLVLDRLDDLLAKAEQQPDFAVVFVRGLLQLEQPYGPEARVFCTHTLHRGGSRGNRATGYQRWRLQTSAWVPVDHHPRGDSLSSPEEAWTHMPKSAESLSVPQYRAKLPDPKGLDLVNAESPSRKDVERSLALLHETFPQAAPEQDAVWDTANWLTQRLERAVKRKPDVGKAPFLPAMTASGAVWSSSPAISDSPGMPLLPGIPVLAPGRWSFLRKAYDLSLASELVRDEVKLRKRLRIPSLLTAEAKAGLVALLVRLGADDTVASRLALLREQGAASLSVTWLSESGEILAEEKRPFHLKVARDRAGRVLRATLFRSADLDPDLVAIGRTVASYLDALDHDHTIALYLTTPESLLEREGIAKQEVEEALELLSRKRLAKDETEDVVVDDSHEFIEQVKVETDVAGPPAPVVLPQNAPVGRTEPPPQPVAPEEVSFGSPRVPEPPVPRAPYVSKPRNPVPQAAVPAQEPDEVAASPNPETELRAMKVAERYGYAVEKAAKVLDVHLENKGWDLEFHYRDGTVIPVEVKGSSGRAPFVITKNEWRAAREHDNFLLIHVLNLADADRAVLRIFRRLGEKLTEQHLAVTSWVVRDWSALVPEERPILTPDS
jgi:hypothetical protein